MDWFALFSPVDRPRLVFTINFIGLRLCLEMIVDFFRILEL
jgi:hypothetical protein